MTAAESRRSARAVLVGALVLLLGASRALAGSSTFVQGRATTNLGNRFAGVSVALDEVPQTTSTTVGGGFYLLDNVLPGSRDRVRMSGGGIHDFIGRTFYAGLLPVLSRDHLTVEESSLLDWDEALDPDATFDETMGIVFGAVMGSTGAPVSGATVSITPGAGDVVYFDDAGVPDTEAVQTGALGRYLILNVPPGEVAVNAAQGKNLLGRAYGRVEADVVTGLSLHPTHSVSGDAIDELGAPVPGALISWIFDTDFAVFADGAGHYDLLGLADGLDVTLRGEAPGFRPARTFSRRAEELDDPPLLNVSFLSDAAYVRVQSGFGITQAPSLGMILGRVLSSESVPVAGATIALEPSVGTIRYFDDDTTPTPDPSATMTSASGLFVVFNVPVGNVVLSAVAPGVTVRSELAPSVAGAVSTGDLRGVPTITVQGRVQDEQFRSDTIGGAVVSVVEYPYLATIVSAGGAYTLPGVPADEYVTFRVDRAGFKTSLSYTEASPKTDLLCVDFEERTDCLDFFVISETSFTNLHLDARQVPNRSRGLLSAAVRLSNGNGAIGLEAGLSPVVGLPLYVADRNTGGASIGVNGALQFFNVVPGLVGVSVFDPRSDHATLRFARIVADAVTVTDDYRLDCDTVTDGSFGNVYPCDGAGMSPLATDVYFQWRSGANVRGQVQISRDPAFATIDLTSAVSGARFTAKQFWRASPAKWKKIKRLGTSGTPIYWRVLGRDVSKVESITEPFVFYLP